MGEQVDHTKVRDSVGVGICVGLGIGLGVGLEVGLGQGSYIPGNESFLYTHANALKAGRLVVP